MRCLSLFILLFILSTSSRCQQVRFNECPSFETIFTKTEIPPSCKSGSDSLKLYFQENIKKIGLKRATGTLTITLIIDRIGHPCLNRYDNQTSASVNDDELINLIRKMPEWVPAFQNGRQVISYASFDLKINDGKIE